MPHRRFWRWTVRILRWLGYAILGITLLVVAALAVVLFTPWGTRTALSFGLGRYDAMIPGSATVERVGGTLAGTLELDGLELADANGDPLVRVGSIRIDLKLLQLVRLTLGFGELAAQDVEVHLWEGRSNWGDLAPPGPEKPKEPGTVGPDLPLGFSGLLALDDVAVLRHGADGQDGSLVRAAVVHGSLFAKGRVAEVRIVGASALVDDAELAVAGLSGAILWDDPVVRVRGLSVISNRGIVKSADVDLDALLLEGEVELAALLDVNSLVPKSNLPINGVVEVDVKGAGGAKHAWATLIVAAEPAVRLHVLLGGSIDPRMDLAGAGVIDLRAVPGRPRTALFTAMHVVREKDSPLFATLAARGGVEAAPVGALVRAEVAPDGSPIDVDAFVYAADTTLTAKATIRDKALARADAKLDVPSLGHLRRAVHPWVDLPAMSGAAAAQLDCTGAGTRLDCDLGASVTALAIADGRVASAEIGASIALRNGRPHGDVSLRANDLRWGDRRVNRLDVSAAGDREAVHVEVAARAPEGRASLAADIAPGERTVVDLRHLVVKSHPVWAKLVRPSRITVEKGQADIEHFVAVVNGGRIEIDGAVGKRNDARLVVSRFDLEALEPLDLPVELDGVLAARGRFRGELLDPQVQLTASVDGLRVDEQRLGRLEVDLGLRERHAIAAIRWRTEDGEHAEIDANVDLRRFDHPRGPGLVRGRPIELVAEVEGIRLSRLREIAKDDELDGRAGLTLRASGTAESPEVAVSVTATDLRVRGLLVQLVQATASHVDGRMEATLQADAHWLKAFRAEAHAPARLRLEPAAFTIDREGDVDVVVGLEDLQLWALQALFPDLRLTGAVSADVVATVHSGHTHADVNVAAADVRLDDKPIGTGTLAATLGDDRLEARLHVAGAAARSIVATVDVPVSVHPLRGEFEWLKDGSQLVELAVDEADVGALTHVAGISGFSGRLDGAAHLEGRAAAPVVVAEFTGSRLVASGRPIGEVELAVEHADGILDAHVRQRQGVAQRIDLDARVPIAIDLAKGKVAWNERGRHDLDVHAIGVDEQILRQFVAVPEDMRLDVTARVTAHGHPAEFDAHGEVRASVGQGGHADVPISAMIDAGPLKQSARVVIGPFGESTILARVQAYMPVLAVARGKSDVRDTKIAARLDADAFPLSALAPLMPPTLQDPSGKLLVHASADGTIGHPVLDGRFVLTDGRLTLVPMRQRFRDIQLAIRMHERDVVLENLSAKSGPGRASAKGRVHLARGDVRGKLEIVAKELPVVRPGLPVMKLSSRIAVDLDATGKMTEIDIVARRSTLDVFTSKVPAPERIPESDGVTYTDVRSKKKKAETRATAKEPMVPSDVKVAFRFADPIFIRGPQANMTWRGGIEIESRGPGQVTAKGALVADRGRINLLGKDFELDHGRVTMPERGEIDPYIDVVARTETPEATVNVIVRGRASRPELRFTSDPPMPESDVFALLVTGSSDSGHEGDGSDTEAKAASLLAAFQNPVLQRELQDSLGIDRVGVAFGDDVDQPIVTVGKRVSRKVYVETKYHHNAPKNDNTAEVQLEYSIKPPNWTVETFFGDAAEGGLGVWWRKRFGGGKRPTAEAPEQGGSPPPP